MTTNAHTRSDRVRRWVRPWACAGGVGVLTLLCGAGPPCGYEITAVIQAPPCPPPFNDPPPTIPTAINEFGRIAGFYSHCPGQTGQEAFFWSEDGFVTLAVPTGTVSAEAWGLNDAGQIVGTFNPPGPSGQHGFLWEAGTWTVLPPENDGIFSGAYAINSAGQVTGYRDIDTSTRNAFLWDKGLFDNIAPLFGTQAIGRGVNDSGRVVGWMGTSQVIDAHAFLWAGTVNDLGPIPGGFTSAAEAISNTGEVVGSGQIPVEGAPFGRARAFLWDGGEMTNLGVLPGFERSAAGDISDAGDIVGGSWGLDGNPNISRAVLWRRGVISDLNDLVAGDSGLILTWASAINGQGQIAVSAKNETNNVLGVVLSPIPVPVGDVTGDGVVDLLDLIDLLTCFGEVGNPPCDGADVNEDGVVNVLDLIALLLTLGHTCL